VPPPLSRLKSGHFSGILMSVSAGPRIT
jgi:hypothetical protein